MPGTVTRERPPHEGPKGLTSIFMWGMGWGRGLTVPWHVVRKCPQPPGLPQVCWPCLARNAKSCCLPFCGPFLPLGVVTRMQRGVGTALQ